MKLSSESQTIPNREGKRPETGAQPPHLQFSDISPRPIYDQMAEWALLSVPDNVPFVRHHPTMISVPTSEALWLDESVPAAREAFMPPAGSREFAHLHADGSWHLVVDETLVKKIVEASWGERHPWYDRGVLEVLVYAPRNEAEMQVVQQLVLASIEHASNLKLNAA
jgi:hypothetical protein